MNRSVAHGRAYGPAAGLAVLGRVDGDALGGSHLLPSVRGDLLARMGRGAEAAAFRDAAARTSSSSERALLLRRAAELS